MGYAQLVVVPLLILFTWGYVALRPVSGRGAAMNALDAAVVAVALSSSVAAGFWIAGSQTGSVWQVVMSTVAIFHVYAGMLIVAWLLRRRIFGDAGSIDE